MATGELSQHRYGQSGAIQASDIPAVINQINMGLTALHTQFPLKERELVIQQFDHITEYKLNSLYALTNDDPSINYKYIMDSVENPFLDDLIRIERAFDEGGNSVPLNDDYADQSWFTVAWDTIQITRPVSTNVSIIMYRAKHPTIPVDVDTSRTLVDIPPMLEEALQAYVASRCYVALGNQSSAQLSSYYSARYNEQIDIVERKNSFHSSDGDSNIKLGMKGFY